MLSHSGNDESFSLVSGFHWISILKNPLKNDELYGSSICQSSRWSICSLEWSKSADAFKGPISCPCILVNSMLHLQFMSFTWMRRQGKNDCFTFEKLQRPYLWFVNLQRVTKKANFSMKISVGWVVVNRSSFLVVFLKNQNWRASIVAVLTKMVDFIYRFGSPVICALAEQSIYETPFRIVIAQSSY